MRGYFNSLAKQSGVLIRAGQAPARPNPAPHARQTDPVAPLESETVYFVDSTPTAVSQAPAQHSAMPSNNRSKSTADDLPLSGQAPPPTEIASQGEAAINSFAAPAVSQALPEAVSNDAIDLGPGRVETSFASENPPVTRMLEPRAQPVRPGDEDSGDVFEDRLTKQGVIRLREPENIGMKTAPQADSFGAEARDLTPAAGSIPHDYLEGIRQWLTAAPIDSEESERRIRTRQNSEKAFGTGKEERQSHRPHLVETVAPAQNEIQEFSLSIGTISIVVEEAGQPKQPAPMAQPHTNATTTPAQQAHDAFALTRRYFRGL